MVVKESISVPKNQVKSVAIIGGGASGAIALESLLGESQFDKIVIFERRSKLGGIWSVDADYGEIIVTPGLNQSDLDPPIEVPSQILKQEKVHTKRVKQERYEKAPALYDYLRTNIPQTIMTYSDDKKFPWLDKPGQDELTTMDSVNLYINQYFARHLESPKVELNLGTTVEKLVKKGSKFEIVLRTELENETDEWLVFNFDAVIVATGHYNVPFIPNVKNIDQVYSKYPGRIIHVKGFNSFQDYKDKKVIVIGGKSSSVDTVRGLKTAGAEVIWSVTEIPEVVGETLRKPIIESYELKGDDLIVKFLDDTEIVNPAKIIYATGYQFSFPFLTEFDPNIVVDSIIPNLYQQTFHINDPLLTFVGIPINGMSFRVFEYQLILISRFLAGKVGLPSLDEQVKWRDQRILERPKKKDYHRTDLDPALGYIDTLVSLGGGYEQLENEGKTFPKFSEADLELYENNRITLHTAWSLL